MEAEARPRIINLFFRVSADLEVCMVCFFFGLVLRKISGIALVEIRVLKRFVVPFFLSCRWNEGIILYLCIFHVFIHVNTSPEDLESDSSKIFTGKIVSLSYIIIYYVVRLVIQK